MGDGCCCSGICAKCKGVKWLVVGILVLVNEYALMWTWGTFIGALLILDGLVKMVKPSCGHCDMPVAKKGKKK